MCLLSCFSHVQLFATPWTVACQAPPSMGFSRLSTGVGCHFFLQRIFLTHRAFNFKNIFPHTIPAWDSDSFYPLFIDEEPMTQGG